MYQLFLKEKYCAFAIMYYCVDLISEFNLFNYVIRLYNNWSDLNIFWTIYICFLYSDISKYVKGGKSLGQNQIYL